MFGLIFFPFSLSLWISLYISLSLSFSFTPHRLSLITYLFSSFPLFLFPLPPLSLFPPLLLPWHKDRGGHLRVYRPSVPNTKPHGSNFVPRYPSSNIPRRLLAQKRKGSTRNLESDKGYPRQLNGHGRQKSPVALQFTQSIHFPDTIYELLSSLVQHIPAR